MKRPGSFAFSTIHIYTLLFGLLGFFLPTQLGRHFFPPFAILGGVRIDYLAPTFYVVDVILLAIILLHQSAIVPVVRSRWFYGLLVVLGINTLFSNIPPLSAYWALRTIEGVWVAAVIASARKSLNGFFWGSLAQAIVQLGLVSFQYITHHSAGGWWWFLGERPLSTSLPDIAKATMGGVEYLRPYGTFSHPNSMGGYYALLAILTLILVPKKSLKWALAGTSVALVLSSLSKGAIIALCAAVLVLFVRRTQPVYKTYLGAVYVGLVTLGVAVFVQIVHSDPIATEKRLALVAQSLKLLQKHLLWGVGRGAYVAAQAPHDFGYAYFFAQPVHSILLLFAVETGLLGVCAAVWFVMRKRSQLCTPAATALLVVVGVSGFVDHYWLTLNQNWYLMWVAIGLIAATKRTRLKSG
jgi:hypothetical protein